MGYSTGYFSENGPFFKIAITQKFELRISSNFLHSIRTSICIRKCDKNFLHFRSHFLEKSMGYSTGYFSENGPFFKIAITQKFELRISSNFLHSIRTSICIRKCDKNFLHFWSHFLEKSMGYIVQGIFQILAFFLNGHNSKNLSRNQLKLSTKHKDINMYQKM